MRETTGNLWTLAKEYHPDFVCVTTNLVTGGRGMAVMGAGVAKEANQRLLVELDGRKVAPAEALGRALTERRHHVLSLGRSWWKETGRTTRFKLIVFPTKRHWRDPSPLDLVVKSTRELARLLIWEDLCFLPRPGCGKGGLSWEEQVKPAVKGLLQDNVVVVGRSGT